MGRAGDGSEGILERTIIEREERRKLIIHMTNENGGGGCVVAVGHNLWIVLCVVFRVSCVIQVWT